MIKTGGRGAKNVEHLRTCTILDLRTIFVHAQLMFIVDVCPCWYRCNEFFRCENRANDY